jgi:hypothetical protein
VGRVRLAAVVVGAALALWSAAGAFAAVAPDGRNGPSESDFVAQLGVARQLGIGVDDGECHLACPLHKLLVTP